jgi:hypothetical protein
VASVACQYFTSCRYQAIATKCNLGGAVGRVFIRTQDIAITGRYIPNSPTNVVGGGFTAGSPRGVSGSIRARHFGGHCRDAKSSSATTATPGCETVPLGQWISLAQEM